MTLINWATHVLQYFLQKEAIMRIRANLQKKIKYELQIETYLYEVGIVSNRKLVRYGESQYLSSVHTARHIKEVNFN